MAIRTCAAMRHVAPIGHLFVEWRVLAEGGTEGAPTGCSAQTLAATAEEHHRAVVCLGNLWTRAVELHEEAERFAA